MYGYNIDQESHLYAMYRLRQRPRKSQGHLELYRIKTKFMANIMLIMQKRKESSIKSHEHETFDCLEIMKYMGDE